MEMEKIFSVGSIMALIFLICPGFLYGRFKAWVTQKDFGERESLATVVYMNLVRSVVLLGLTTIVFGFAQIDGLVEAVNKGDATWMFQSRNFALLTGVELVLWPAVAGLITGVLELTGLLHWIRRSVGLPAIAFDQAWDAAFAHVAQVNKDVVVLIEFRLKKPDATGKNTLFGQFDQHSAASKTGPYYDVWCSDEWVVQGDRIVPARCGGLFVRGGEYSSIRFLLISQDGSNVTSNESGDEPVAE